MSGERAEMFGGAPARLRPSSAPSNTVSKGRNRSACILKTTLDRPRSERAASVLRGSSFQANPSRRSLSIKPRLFRRSDKEVPVPSRAPHGGGARFKLVMLASPRVLGRKRPVLGMAKPKAAPEGAALDDGDSLSGSFTPPCAGASWLHRAQ